jgi:hypothetical protein
MKMSVSSWVAASGRPAASARAAASSARIDVVPTAITRRRARGRGDLVDQRLRQVVPLAVHPVLGEVLDAHRLERAGAHVQRQRRALDAHRVELRQQRLVEMQAGRRRGDRAGLRANTVW